MEVQNYFRAHLKKMRESLRKFVNTVDKVSFNSFCTPQT